MKKILAIAGLALLGLTGSAHAALVDVTLGSTGSSLSYGTGGALSPNINLLTLGSNLTTYGAVIVNPASSFAGMYAEPTGPLAGGDYLAVFGGSSTGSATLSLTSGSNTFGFTWGTIDSYNSLTLTDSRGVHYTLTGSELLSQIAGSVPGTTQSDVSFYDPYGTIVTAQLTSTQNSFEAANFEENVSSVPLPASLPLFASVLAGLFFFARQRKNNKAI